MFACIELAEVRGKAGEIQEEGQSNECDRECLQRFNWIQAK